MLTLYIKNGCPYCMRVLAFAQENNIKLAFKDIAEPAIADELIARGGKRMVPYLIDESCSIEMYESADIVDYLEKHYV